MQSIVTLKTSDSLKSFMTIFDFCKTSRKEEIETKISCLSMLGSFTVEKNIAGLDCRVYDHAILFILKAWLHRVWRQFQWPEKMPGVGINFTVLTVARFWKKDIVIIDGNTGEVYVGDPDKILRTCENWVMPSRSQSKILACPKSLLQRYKEQPFDPLIANAQN